MSKDIFTGLPKKLRIGPWDYNISLVHKIDDGQSFGCFTADKCEIQIRVDHPSAPYAVDTVLHELLHAVFHVQSLHESDLEKEEHVVSMVAKAWTQVFRDNPTLLKWIAGSLK